MPRNAGCTFALVGAIAVLGLACAADPGDPLRKASNGATPPGGTSASSSSGGGFGNSSSSGGTSSSSSGSGAGESSSSSGSGIGQSVSGSGGASSSGGSSSGSAGDGGGSNGEAGPGTPTGPQCVTGAKSAQIGYYTDDTTTMGTQMGFHIDVSNGGFGALSLADVTIRYWFSADGNAISGLTAVCDSAQNQNMAMQDIKSAVTPSFAAAPTANVTATSDTYLGISFGAAAGSVPPLGGSPAIVQLRLYGGNYQDKFNEANDYSFDATKKASTYQPSKTITAYLKGQLVWGCEPGAGGAGSGASSDAGGGSD